MQSEYSSPEEMVTDLAENDESFQSLIEEWNELLEQEVETTITVKVKAKITESNETDEFNINTLTKELLLESIDFSAGNYSREWNEFDYTVDSSPQVESFLQTHKTLQDKFNDICKTIHKQVQEEFDEDESIELDEVKELLAESFVPAY